MTRCARSKTDCWLLPGKNPRAHDKICGSAPHVAPGKSTPGTGLGRGPTMMQGRRVCSCVFPSGEYWKEAWPQELIEDNKEEKAKGLNH